MRIQRRSYASNPEIMSVAAAVEYHLDGREYGSGQLESAAQTANNCTRMLGELIEKLRGNGLLSADDVLSLLPGFEEAE
jgi:hypothetical protein